MKRKFVISFIMIIVLALCGCSSESKPEESNASFKATVIEINMGSVTVKPLDGESELKSSDKITFNVSDLEKINHTVGSVVKIYYNGEIMESYPAQIKAEKWELVDRGAGHYFVGEILEIYDGSVLVSTIKGDNIDSIDKVVFSTADLPDIGAEISSKIMVTYNGQVMYSYPAQINAISWLLL